MARITLWFNQMNQRYREYPSYLKVRVDVEPWAAEVVCPGDVGHDALPALPDVRKPHPHVPVPHLEKKQNKDENKIIITVCFCFFFMKEKIKSEKWRQWWEEREIFEPNAITSDIVFHWKYPPLSSKLCDGAKNIFNMINDCWTNGFGRHIKQG